MVSDLVMLAESAAATDPSSERSLVADEVIAALERNGLSFIGSSKTKAKKGEKPRAAAMRIDIPATTPGRTILAVTSIIWEDLVNGARRDGSGGGDPINRKKIQCAEKMIRGAFVELYRGLGLLKTYRFVTFLHRKTDSPISQYRLITTTTWDKLVILLSACRA